MGQFIDMLVACFAISVFRYRHSLCRLILMVKGRMFFCPFHALKIEWKSSSCMWSRRCKTKCAEQVDNLLAQFQQRLKSFDLENVFCDPFIRMPKEYIVQLELIELFFSLEPNDTQRGGSSSFGFLITSIRTNTETWLTVMKVAPLFGST